MSESALEALEGERQSLIARRTGARTGLRPRDAATLVIIDSTGPVPKLLMGRRAAGHVFMPGHFVFPGGRVDPADLALAADFPLSETVLERLCAGPPARYGARQAAASALAAIRETFEEVGLTIAAPGQLAKARGTWKAFAARGIRPLPERLVPLARAITPPGAPRRFDARFFVMDAGEFAASLPPTPPTDELDAVEWVPIDRTQNFSLAAITQRVLGDLGQRIADGSWQDPSQPIPFYRVVNNRFVREYL